MTVTVFGLGFVGLTTALGLASKGHLVYGFDVDTARRETIASGHLPFLEPGLDDALQQELGQHFHLTDTPAHAVSQSECVFFCVGTPYGDNGQADLTYLFSAVDLALAGTDGEKFYPYTMLEEASRERFIYVYRENSSYSTVDFVQRAIIYFGYAPDEIQTDNGGEFTHTQKTSAYILWISSATIGTLDINESDPKHLGTTEK